MTVYGITWQGWKGVFFSPRFRPDLQLFVAGKRGEWEWRLHCHQAKRVLTQGKASTKLGAMAAAAVALRHNLTRASAGN